jgi:hypothetical protein
LNPVLEIRPFSVPVYEPIAPWGSSLSGTVQRGPVGVVPGSVKVVQRPAISSESFVFLGKSRLLLNWPITAAIRLQFELGAWRKPCDSTSNRLSKKARNNAFEMLLEGSLLTR